MILMMILLGFVQPDKTTLPMIVLGPAKANRPFDFDKATAAMLDENRKWSRVDRAKDGAMLGVIQVEQRIGFGLMYEEVYPFDLPSLSSYNTPKTPYKRIISVSSLTHNK